MWSHFFLYKLELIVKKKYSVFLLLTLNSFLKFYYCHEKNKLFLFCSFISHSHIHLYYRARKVRWVMLQGKLIAIINSNFLIFII